MLNRKQRESYEICTRPSFEVLPYPTQATGFQDSSPPTSCKPGDPFLSRWGGAEDLEDAQGGVDCKASTSPDC